MAAIALQAALLDAPIELPPDHGATVGAYTLKPIGAPWENRVQLELNGPITSRPDAGLELVRPADAGVGPVRAVFPGYQRAGRRRRLVVQLQVPPGVWKLRVRGSQPFGAVRVHEDRVPDL